MIGCAEILLSIPYRVVNGRLDLVNLFPVKLDLKPFIDAWGSSATFKLSAPNGTLNFCGVDIAPEAAGTIQTNDVYTMVAPRTRCKVDKYGKLKSVCYGFISIFGSDASWELAGAFSPTPNDKKLEPKRISRTSCASRAMA